MSEEFSLDQVDVDGAIRETAHDASTALESNGDTRLGFFKKAGMAGGALMGGGAILSALVPGAALAGERGRPPSSFGTGDIGILNFALTLEYLERDFYNEASKNQRKKGGLSLKGAEHAFLQAVVPDEKAHVEFLQKALGSAAIQKPKFDFGKTTSDRDLFLETSFQLEDTGVGAYSGQAFNIANVEYLKVALSIVTIEARHTGLIGQITRGKNGVAPHGPFDRKLRADQVLKRVGKTGFIKG